MKIAISLPDPLFDTAEELARELGLSRSRLYARALAEFVSRLGRGDVTARLDAVYGDPVRDELDPVLAEMQASSLPPETW